jgi:hypothetical protein
MLQSKAAPESQTTLRGFVGGHGVKASSIRNLGTRWSERATLRSCCFTLGERLPVSTGHETWWAPDPFSNEGTNYHSFYCDFSPVEQVGASYLCLSLHVYVLVLCIFVYKFINWSTITWPNTLRMTHFHRPTQYRTSNSLSSILTWRSCNILRMKVQQCHLIHCGVTSFGGPHPTSYPMGTTGSFPGGKAAGARSWPLTSI